MITSFIINSIIFATIFAQMSSNRSSVQKSRIFVDACLLQIRQRLRTDVLELGPLLTASEFIDHMVLSLQSGENVRRAFLRAAMMIREESLQHKSTSIQMSLNLGDSLSEALGKAIRQEKQRTSVQTPFMRVCEHLLLSLETGSDVVSLLQRLAEDLRNQAHSALEESAARAPVKMLFPLVLFILPVIFLLLGAAAVNELFLSLNLVS